MSIIIGLTGANASGKGEVAAILANRGFRHHSLSDIIREQAAAEKLPPEREHLIRIGNDLRRSGGPAVLAQRIVERLDGRDVIDSIRNPAEVQELRKVEGFVLLGIRAPIEIRFQRSLLRARPGDPETLEGFVAREAQENSSDPAAQQLSATFALADHEVDNDGDLARLQATVDRLLLQLNVPNSR